MAVRSGCRRHLVAAQAELDAVALELSNLVEPGVPVGGEDDYVVLEEVGIPATRGRGLRAPRPRGPRAAAGAIDIERATKVSGARFYYLTGVGALLELALVNLAMSRARAAGFVR